MQKQIEETNAINWFQIPVLETSRAKKFYETILEIKMQTKLIPETEEELTFFPFSPGVIRATSGRVSGVLTKSQRSKPSMDGITVFLNANPVIQNVIDKIEPAGGKIIIPKTKVQAGYFSIFIDPEGNKIGLHARA
jgi:predicted enzyme related to lactoylglutathione lyase